MHTQQLILSSVLVIVVLSLLNLLFQVAMDTLMIIQQVDFYEMPNFMKLEQELVKFEGSFWDEHLITCT